MPIEKPTVLILGAGASRPYGFPVGIGLRDAVCERLLEPVVQIFFKQLGFGRDGARKFADAVRHSAYPSVDTFLEAYPKYLEIGKMAIAVVLLPFEDHDKLFSPRVRSQSHWYELLINKMDPGGTGWNRNRLTVVTFNYDRSFEHYFITVLQQRAGVSAKRAATMFRRVEVIHVHGQLGSYPHLGSDPVTYGARTDKDPFGAAARAIRVVSDAGDDLAPFKRAKKKLLEAQRAYFLGFGFADVSVGRLGVFGPEERHWDVGALDGTSKGVPERDWARICRDLFSGSMNPRRFRRSVSEFLRERAALR